MSEWEINNIGIQCACDYLRKQGVTSISYNDVIGIAPQIWFEKDGENCYAFVRSIPAGLSKEKYHIKTGNLNLFSENKGYFFRCTQWDMSVGQQWTISKTRNCSEEEIIHGILSTDLTLNQSK